MVPSAQRKLFHYVDEQVALYTVAWAQLYTQLSNSETAGQQVQNALLKQRGLKTQILSERMPLVYGELATGADSTLLFYQCCDLRVPGMQEVEEIAALLAAIEVCQNVAGRLPVNIKWLLDGGGKQDDPELSRCLEEHSALLQADAALWSYTNETGIGADGSLLALGTKGLLSVELAIQTGSTAIDIMHSGIVPNALWRLVWALNSLKDAQEDVKIEGFYDALAPASDSATEMLATLPDNALSRRWSMPQFLMDLQGFRLHYTHFLMPTCTVTTITSKPTENEAGPTLPTQATARVDFQLVPEQDPYAIFTLLRQHLDEHGFHDVQARMLFASRPIVTTVDDPFVQSVTQATEMAYEQTPYLLPMTVGSYALHPLRMKSDMPIVLVARNRQNGHVAFAALIKQLAAILLEGTAYATDSTQ